MTSLWCCELVKTVIEKHGKPEIINTYQGVQYTSDSFSHLIKKEEIQLSINVKLRALGNIYIERFYRSIKYEKLPIMD